MRPIALQVKGFTAFRDEQTIDFSDLDLFVLTGATGSGKSSLLDAMTYALFGWVERVGNQVTQLVSQGQPRMAVTLDFSVGDKVYRVTRTTTSGGQSKALLERQEGEDWESYGEGADSIREVNRIIKEDLLGLDYDAFTRAVILPQGKFAEFLTGDAKRRREILTDLLGLELFGRMAGRAGEIQRAAKISAETRQGVLDGEYADVTEAALVEARAHHDRTKAALEGAEKLEVRLGEISTQWTATETSVKSLDRCARQATELAGSLLDSSSQLDASSVELAAAKTDLEVATRSVTDAEIVATATAAAAAAGEKRSGDLTTLNQLVMKVDNLELAHGDLAEATKSLARAREEEANALADEKKLATEAKAAAKSKIAAEEDLVAARARHEEAHRSDLVGALTVGLSAGDPCPVCEHPLAHVPSTDQTALDESAVAVAAAETRLKEATAAAADVEKRTALIEQSLTTARANIAACSEAEARRRKRVDELTDQLVEVLGEDLDDPASELDRRIAELDELTRSAKDAATVLDEARTEVDRRTIALERKGRAVAEIGIKVASLPIAQLLEQVEETAADVDLPERLPQSLPDDAAALASLVATAAKDLERVSEELEARAAGGRRKLKDLKEEARSALPDRDAAGADLQTIISAAKASTRALTGEATRAAGQVESLTAKLATRQRLEQEIIADRTESALYADLVKELKSDRIVSFLQAEALRTLAAAAGKHLRDLSRERYELAYEDDRFYVVDAWNGNERRNVKTLSGGETFLASLALALALSEQIQYLAVTERDRLDSLFLDEGFGTLDPETLEAVVEGIEQLGQNGRLVGVITHVQELADQLPVRLTVTKSPRGSKVSRSSEPLTGSG